MAKFGAGAAGATKLAGLTDVNPGASPADNSVLVFSTSTGVWGAGSIVSGNTIALAGLTDVTGTSTEGQALLRKSSSYGFGEVGSGGLADGAVTTPKLPAKAVTLPKLSAGTSTTDGHVLTVSGSTGDVVAEAIPVQTVAQIFGITGTPSANDVIKRNSANDGWAYAADATGGDGGGGSGIALTDLSASGIIRYDSGTGAFSTNAAGFASAVEAILTTDFERAKITGIRLVGTGTIDSSGELKRTTPNIFSLRLSAAQNAEVEPMLATGTIFKVRNGDGTERLSTVISGRPVTLPKVGDDFRYEIIVASEGSIGGSTSATGLTLEFYSPGYENRVEAMVEEVHDAIKTDGDVTAGTQDANGDFQLNIRDGQVGLGKLTAGNATSGQILTVSGNSGGVVAADAADNFETNLAAELDDLEINGIQFANSATDLPKNRIHVNSATNTVSIRGDSAAETAAYRKHLKNGRTLSLRQGNESVFIVLNADPTESDGAGGEAEVKVFAATYGTHDARGASITGNWNLTVWSKLKSALRGVLAARTVTAPAIAPGAVGPVATEGLVQETRMFMNNDGSGSRKQRISGTATTDFGTGTVTSDTTHNVKSWAIGNGSNEGEHFDQKRNMTLLNATLDFSGFRAEAGNLYSIFMDGMGVLYSGAANNSNLPVAVEVGLSFRDKDPDESDWQSWAHCGNADVSRTIGGASKVVYDASNFYGSSNFLSGQNKVVFRTKGTLYGDVVNTNFYADVSPPFWASFEVGDSDAAFPVADRDYQFRFVFRAAEVGNNHGAIIDRIYNYTERLIARRVA